MNPTGAVAPDPEDIRIPASDGFSLAATLFEPARTPAPVVVIASATAVRRGFYRDFASFLASEGFRVVTFDYRGVGGSRAGRLRGFAARKHEWAHRDAAGVLRWAARHWEAERVLVVGHSFGGQALGLLPEPERVAAAVLVAAASGYWGHWSGTARLGMFLLWHGVLPIVSRVCGYMPGRAAGFGEDLPRDVALDWARWGRHPGYVAGVFAHDGHAEGVRFKGLAIPMLAYSFPDDGLAPGRAVDALLRCHPTARVERRHVTPASLGLRSIGHFGFFRSFSRATLWPEALAFLRAQAPATPGGAPGPS